MISRLYRDGLKRSIADVFRIQVISNSEAKSPVLTLGSTSFLHVKHENVYVVAVTRSNVDAGLVFEFLYKFINLCTGYFNKFDEQDVKNNFTFIYELVDEIVDFGYPQNTELNSLKEYITTEGIKSEKKVASIEESSKITMQATGSVSWRKPDIKYRKNEVFVDILEKVNLSMSATGAVLKADVNGQIKFRTKLSGFPECKFGLNDSLQLEMADGEGANPYMSDHDDYDERATSLGGRMPGSVMLEDCQFHQCVKLGKFDRDRTITFIPPDGEFELMRYRAVENINLPFRIIPQVREIGQTRVEYSVTVKALFGAKLHATDVVIRVPTPLNAAKTSQTCSSGRVKYDPGENQIVWRVNRFPGGAEFNLTASVELAPTMTRKLWSRPPISMDFNLAMFTSSGIAVRYLKIFEKSNYTPLKWVKYIVQAGSYEVRF